MNIHSTDFNFSVIIPTYKRYNYVINVLELLNQQTINPYEVIIVDATPSENRIDLSKKYFYEWLTYIPVEFQGNISKQRNIAILQARGNTLIFLDDDVIFESDLLENFKNAFEETEADGICGIILDRGFKKDMEFMMKKRSTLLNPGGVNLRYADFIKETSVISTANFACKKEAVISVGGFDEELFGTIEDVDLGVRLTQAGYKILHHNKPKLNHLAIKSSGSRSPSLGLIWQYSNLFYFQMKHYHKDKHQSLLIKCVLDIIRPSKSWFKPNSIFNRINIILPAFRQARKRFTSGPKYISINK